MNLFQKYYLVTLTDKKRGPGVKHYQESRMVLKAYSPIQALQEAFKQHPDMALLDIQRI